MGAGRGAAKATQHTLLQTLHLALALCTGPADGVDRLRLICLALRLTDGHAVLSREVALSIIRRPTGEEGYGRIAPYS